MRVDVSLLLPPIKDLDFLVLAWRKVDPEFLGPRAEEP
jgi:hypothetical protein